MPPRNPWLCVLIATLIGVAALSCVGGIIATSVMRLEPHASLVSIASTCVGALASFLVVVPQRQNQIGFPAEQPTAVQQQPQQQPR